MTRRFLVVGAGIGGLAAAVELVAAGGQVVVADAAEQVGGKLRSSTFAGIDGIDEGADAYLTRVDAAVELAAVVGAGPFKHPTDAHAAVWHDGLHRLPPGIVLGVPAALRPLATTRLLSWRGKARALADFVLPRTAIADDRLGALTRRRFGDEVHERLIDSLIGSIYAADTDQYSLAAVPQLAALAERRSLAWAARSRARAGSRAAAPGSADAPIFAAPSAGMERLAATAADWLVERGAEVRTATPVTSVQPSGKGWTAVLADTAEQFDGVVIATPASVAAQLLGEGGWSTAAELASTIVAADVIMVRLRIPAEQWPRRLSGLSGFLVPKPDQRWVTAASFGSQKWSTWRPDNGDEVLRVSLGRDGSRVDHLDDPDVIDRTLDDLERHLGTVLAPTESSITRWIDGFPQYRPHHGRLVDSLERALPAGMALAGASYRGIGVPACVASGTRAAYNVLAATSPT